MYDWLYLLARVGLAIVALAAAWITARHAGATVRTSDRGHLGFAGAALLIAAASLSVYDGIDNALLRPDDPIQPSSWLWFFIFDLSLPIYALLLVRSQRERETLLRCLQEQSVTDTLTDLLNRRGFLDQAAASIAQARRAGMYTAVAMLDLDHFKTVNDTLGHAAGDALLRAVANTARRELRAGDLFGRLGGDEFGLLIVGPGMGEAVEAADRIVRAVAAELGSIQGCEGVGVSGGIATVGLLGEAMAALAQALSVADAALYGAKRSGRGRLVVSDPVEFPAADAARNLSQPSASVPLASAS